MLKTAESVYENGALTCVAALISALEFQESELADDSCVVKVRFTFTFAILVPRSSSYATLAEKISEKLSVPANAIVLR